MITPSARELADLEMLLDGGFAPLTGFMTAAEIRDGRLADGTRWPLPVTLAVPPDFVADRIELADPEGTPVAELTVTETWATNETRYAAGPVAALRPAEWGAFRRLRRTADSVRAELAGAPVVAHIVTEPPLTAELAQLRGYAADRGARVLLLPAVGETGSEWSTETLIKAALATGELTVPIPLSAVDSEWLRSIVARNYGATARYDLPRTVPGHDRVTELLDQGEPLPADLVPPEVAAVLRQARPPRAERGVVVFFTGLSGSGKSTVAKGVADAIAETTRTVTLLDGDIVRRLLSAGLTFSRADRDLNIARIGYVAAEAARHGGIALCAPIAPYAAARAEVRARARQVADFVLVHVATPLAVCEARDRKGLYAKARAGLIPEFTGISDPYEDPTDADLRIDTSEISTTDSVRQVLDFLTARGYLPPATLAIMR